MHSESRRNFVKKSLATSVTISFAGLIRAHGQEGGGTTWDPNQSTTNSGGTTTWNPNQGTTYYPNSTTWDPNQSTTYYPESTTAQISHKREIQWGLIVVSHPKSSDGSPLVSDLKVVDVNKDNVEIGTLHLKAISVHNPDPNQTVTAAEKANGIPESKIKLELHFQQKAKLEYQGGWPAWLTGGTQKLPGDPILEYEETPLVEIELARYSDTIGPWSEGDSEPDSPSSPEILDSPDSDATKNTSPSSGNMGMVGEWSAWGWTWIGTFFNNPTFQLTVPSVGSWTPGDEEGKTGTISMVWSGQVAKRSRRLKKQPGGDWESIPDSENPADTGGWSKWKPAQ